MPPRRFSRYAFCEAVKDDQGRLFLTDREPFRYRPLPDNTAHPVGEGDTLWTLAGKYFARFPNPNDLWWVIGDFQPEPIIDATVKLAVGTIVIIPSERTLTEDIFSEARRDELGG